MERFVRYVGPADETLTRRKIYFVGKAEKLGGELLRFENDLGLSGVIYNLPHLVEEVKGAIVRCENEATGLCLGNYYEAIAFERRNGVDYVWIKEKNFSDWYKIEKDFSLIRKAIPIEPAKVDEVEAKVFVGNPKEEISKLINIGFGKEGGILTLPKGFGLGWVPVIKEEALNESFLPVEKEKEMGKIRSVFSWGSWALKWSLILTGLSSLICVHGLAWGQISLGDFCTFLDQIHDTEEPIVGKAIEWYALVFGGSGLTTLGGLAFYVKRNWRSMLRTAIAYIAPMIKEELGTKK